MFLGQILIQNSIRSAFPVTTEDRNILGFLILPNALMNTLKTPSAPYSSPYSPGVHQIKINVAPSRVCKYCLSWVETSE